METTVAICIIVAFIFIAIVMTIYKIKKLGLRQFAINLISQAENMAVQNSEKMDYCIDQFIKIIPAPINLFITRDMIRVFIQKIFNEIKIALDTTKAEKIEAKEEE